MHETANLRRLVLRNPQGLRPDGQRPPYARRMTTLGDAGAAARLASPSGGEAVQAITGRVAAQLETISRRLVLRYQEEIADYRLATDEGLLEDVHGVTLGALRVIVADLASGHRPAPDELEVVRAGAARRVHQHVSLESFLHAVRLQGRTLWETVMQCTDHAVAAEVQAALTIAGRLLEHLDLQSIAAAQGYMSELHNVWTDQALLRRDLLDALLAGDGDSESVRRLAHSLRLQLRSSYFVVIVRTGQPVVEDAADQMPAPRGALRRIMEATRVHLRSRAGALLIGMRHGDVVALHPFQDPAEGRDLRVACVRLAEELATLRVAIGLSGAGVGLATLPVSYSEARESVDIAHTDPARGSVVAFEDVLLDSVVRGTRRPERIINETVGKLLDYDRARHSELVPTLRAYVAAGFNLAKSAEALSVHPNTVVYRLGRIKSLTGRDPHMPDDLLLLQLGLKLLELRTDA
jgi:sugar diacid utilization regulator